MCGHQGLVCVSRLLLGWAGCRGVSTEREFYTSQGVLCFFLLWLQLQDLAREVLLLCNMATKSVTTAAVGSG